MKDSKISVDASSALYGCVGLCRYLSKGIWIGAGSAVISFRGHFMLSMFYTRP
jgi:hypothetical protein